jgi:hypothetical protein
MLAPPPDFNARVLALADEHAPKGFGGYAWPAPEGLAGTTRDLRVGDDVIAKGGDGNHCVGMTLEVFWRALAQCPGGVEAALDVAAAKELVRVWYVPDFGGAGMVDALPAQRLGQRITTLDDARPGDFVQMWNADESSGHSLVFLGWNRDDAGAITGIRYWSSQPWADGIGTAESTLGATDAAYDLSRVYVARASCR